MVRGKILTICWHVDDLKISHVDKNVVTRFIRDLEKIYGKCSVSRGKYHDYLGMKLDFRKKDKEKIDMREYVCETYKMFPEDLGGWVSTPAAEHLREINEEAEKLEPVKKQIFHTITARSLFCGKRARPDLQPTIAYLCTRVREPDVDDWKKLRRLMKFMEQTKDDVLTLSMDDMRLVKWYVDGSYAVHPDCKSQTGATMTMGSGSVYSSSQKQKINTRSSTETELVATDDMLPQVLWSKYFMDEQGITASHLVNQDNTSAEKLETRGRMSSGKRTKHMCVRYFFIKDRVDAGDFKVVHCPTTEMVGDFFTKPLQGKLFLYFRAIIMGFDMKSTDGKIITLENFEIERTEPSKECVGQADKK